MSWQLQQNWWRIRGLIISAAALVALSGCVTAHAAPADAEWLALENDSPDAIRVSLELDGREILLGRVGSLQREHLRLPAGYSLYTQDARIRVSRDVSSNRYGFALDSGGNQVSQWYSGEELLRGAWRYTGTRIMWVGPRR